MQYALQLARLTSTALERLRVQGAAPDTARARLVLFDSARLALAQSLKLLGLTPLERV